MTLITLLLLAVAAALYSVRLHWRGQTEKALSLLCLAGVLLILYALALLTGEST